MSADEVNSNEAHTPATASELLVGTASGGRVIASQIDAMCAGMTFIACIGILPAYMPQVVAGVTAVGSYFAYFFTSEWLLGSSPGKYALGLVVKQISGRQCTARQIAIRTLSRLVEANVAVLGAIPAGIAILATKRRQRLGDLFAGTVVVKRPASNFQRAEVRVVTRYSRRSDEVGS